MKKTTLLAAILTFAFALGACDGDGVKRQANTTVRFVHAAPSLADALFLREERQAAIVAFGGGSVSSFEVGQYDFNVDVDNIATGRPDRLLSFSETLLVDTEYTFVMVETPAGLEPLVVTTPRFDPASSDTEVVVTHAALSRPDLDVYLLAPSTPVTGATPIGGLDYTSSLTPQVMAPGDYRLSITTAGDPTDLVYRSSAFTFLAGQSYTFVITDDDSPGLDSLSVVSISDVPARLADINAPTSLRVLNVINDRADRDIVIDEEFATPLFPALAFGTVPAYASLTPGAHMLTVTPAGNPGVEELATEVGLSAGREYTTMVTTGLVGPVATTAVESRRPISGRAKLRIYNAATNFGLIDLYLAPAGTNIDDILPGLFTQAPNISSVFPLPPRDDYELTLVARSSGAVIAGPLTFALEDLGVYGVLIVNDPGGSTAQVLLIDDF